MADEIYDDELFDDDDMEFIYTNDEGLEIPISAATAAKINEQYAQGVEASAEQEQFEEAFLAQAGRVENHIGRRLTNKEFQTLAEDGVPDAQSSGQMPDLVARYHQLGIDQSHSTSTEDGRRNLMSEHMSDISAEQQAAEGVTGEPDEGNEQSVAAEPQHE